MPSPPQIREVQPFSSTAVLEFEEPSSSGGVTILKYRVEWRLPRKEWKSEEYKAEDSKLFLFSPTNISPQHIENCKKKISALLTVFDYTVEQC